jgi:hypothetical protein
MQPLVSPHIFPAQLSLQHVFAGPHLSPGGQGQLVPHMGSLLVPQWTMSHWGVQQVAFLQTCVALLHFPVGHVPPQPSGPPHGPLAGQLGMQHDPERHLLAPHGGVHTQESMHVPALQICPAMQVTPAHGLATHLPLMHDWPATQVTVAQGSGA